MKTAFGHGLGGPKAHRKILLAKCWSAAFASFDEQLAEREIGENSNPSQRETDAATQMTTVAPRNANRWRVLFSL